MNGSKRFLKQNDYLLIAVIVLLISVIGLAVLQGSYALDNTVISKEEKRTSNTSVIRTSNDNRYMYFEVELINNHKGGTHYLNATIDMKKEWPEIRGKEVKAKLEKSTDNINYTQIKEVELELNNIKELVNSLELTDVKTYYRLSLSADNQSINMTERNADIELDIKTELVFNYEFKEESQEFKVPEDGDYRIELWGASGNYYDNEILAGAQKSYAGKGAYTAGTIGLNKNDTLYIYTGKNATDSGNYAASSFNANTTNSFGDSFSTTADGKKHNHYYASGGGASDVRLVRGANWYDATSLRSRIMVAAGGGGALYSDGDVFGNTQGGEIKVCSGTGGSGGGLVSYPGAVKVPLQKEGVGATASTQTQGGTLDYCVGIDQKYYKDITVEEATAYNEPYGRAIELYKNYAGKYGIGSSDSEGIYLTSINSSGGGGHYGGTVGCNVLYQYESPETHARHTGGAGGSSYISGHTGSIAITSASDETEKCRESVQIPVLNTVYNPTANYVGTTDNSCSIHYSGLKFKDTTMIDGEGYSWTNKRGSKASMPKPEGGTFVTGNEESGAARITALSLGAETILRKGSIVIVTTKYVDEEGNEISDRITEQKEVGNSYTTTQKEIEGYTIKIIPANKEGTVGESDIEVVYIYVKKQSSPDKKKPEDKNKETLVPKDKVTKPEDKTPRRSKNPYTADVIKKYISFAVLSILGITALTLINGERKNRADI